MFSIVSHSGTSEFPATNGPIWYLAADGEESLAELATMVGTCDQVAKSFWSNSEEGESALEEIGELKGGTNPATLQ